MVLARLRSSRILRNPHFYQSAHPRWYQPHTRYRTRSVQCNLVGNQDRSLKARPAGLLQIVAGGVSGPMPYSSQNSRTRLKSRECFGRRHQQLAQAFAFQVTTINQTVGVAVSMSWLLAWSITVRTGESPVPSTAATRRTVFLPPRLLAGWLESLKSVILTRFRQTALAELTLIQLM